MFAFTLKPIAHVRNRNVISDFLVFLRSVRNELNAVLEKYQILNKQRISEVKVRPLPRITTFRNKKRWPAIGRVVDILLAYKRR